MGGGRGIDCALTLKISGGQKLMALDKQIWTRPLDLDVIRSSRSSCTHIGMRHIRLKLLNSFVILVLRLESLSTKPKSKAIGPKMTRGPAISNFEEGRLIECICVDESFRIVTILTEDKVSLCVNRHITH